MILKKLTSFFILFLLVLSTLSSFAFADKQFDSNVNQISDLVDEIDNELEMILTTIAIGKNPSFARLNTLREELVARTNSLKTVLPSDVDSNEELNALADKLDRIFEQLFEIEENSEVIGLNEDLGKDADFAAGMMIRAVKDADVKVGSLDENIEFRADAMEIDSAVEFMKIVTLGLEEQINNAKIDYTNEEIATLKADLDRILDTVVGVKNVAQGMAKIASVNKDLGSLEILNRVLENINDVNASVKSMNAKLDLMNEKQINLFDSYMDKILYIENDVDDLFTDLEEVVFELEEFLNGNPQGHDIPTLEDVEEISQEINEEVDFIFEDLNDLSDQIKSNKKLTTQEKKNLLTRLSEVFNQASELEDFVDDRVDLVLGDLYQFVEDLIAGEDPVVEDPVVEDPVVEDPVVDDEVSDEESKYNELRNRYNEADNDYDRFKRRYREAVEDEDSRDIERYENELRDVREESEDLEEDIEDFIEELEDDNDNDQYDDLINDLENLEEDVEELNENVVRTLRGENRNSDSLNTIVPRVVPEQVTPEPQVVVVQDPTVANGITGASVVNTQASGWENFRAYGWIIGGIIILLALIVFLVAVLLK